MPPSCGCLLFDLFITYDNFCVLFVGVIDFRTSKKRINTQVISYCAIQFCVTSNPHIQVCGYDESVAWSKQAHNVLLFHQGNRSRGIGEKLLMYPSSIYYVCIISISNHYIFHKSISNNQILLGSTWCAAKGNGWSHAMDAWWWESANGPHRKVNPKRPCFDEISDSHGCHASISKSHQCKS